MSNGSNLNQKIEYWVNSRTDAFHSDKRPFVTLAYAQSWGGSITTRKGKPVALSGAASNCLTHQLRSMHDGILVGIDTVLADDPQLTVRYWHGENPQPVVLDSNLRMPHHARLCRHPDKQCWILTTSNLSHPPYKGAEIITLEEQGTRPGRKQDAHSAFRDQRGHQDARIPQ